MGTSISMVSWAVSCRLAYILPFTGTVSPACDPAFLVCFTGGVVAFAAASTSSFVIRPRAPLPCTKLRSTPS